MGYSPRGGKESDAAEHTHPIQHKGKESKEEWRYIYTYIYMHVYQNHFAEHLNPTQHCKLTVLQWQQREATDGWVHEEEGESIIRALGLWWADSAPVTLIVSDPMSGVLRKGPWQQPLASTRQQNLGHFHGSEEGTCNKCRESGVS